MSHFTVGVITRDPHNVDYLLRPYDENGTDYYIKELYMSKEDYINSYKNEHPDTTLTDEQIYATANDMYTGVEEDGIYDYYNPDKQWDDCKPTETEEIDELFSGKFIEWIYIFDVEENKWYMAYDRENYELKDLEEMLHNEENAMRYAELININEKYRKAFVERCLSA